MGGLGVFQLFKKGGGSGAGVNSFNTRTGNVTLQLSDVQPFLNNYIPITGTLPGKEVSGPVTFLDSVNNAPSLQIANDFNSDGNAAIVFIESLLGSPVGSLYTPSQFDLNVGSLICKGFDNFKLFGPIHLYNVSGLNFVSPIANSGAVEDYIITYPVSGPATNGVGMVYNDVLGYFEWKSVVPPFSDINPIIYNNSDSTKKIRLLASNITTGNTRNLSVQDLNYILAGTNISNGYSAFQIFSPTGTAVAGSSKGSNGITLQGSRWSGSIAQLEPITISNEPINSSVAGTGFEIVIKDAANGRFKIGIDYIDFPNYAQPTLRSGGIRNIRLNTDAAYGSSNPTWIAMYSQDFVTNPYFLIRPETGNITPDVVDLWLQGSSTGNVVVAGHGLKIAQRLYLASTDTTNTDIINGRSTLVGGTVTITGLNCTAASNITVARRTAAGTIGNLSAICSSGSATITSSSGSDTSEIFWFITESY